MSEYSKNLVYLSDEQYQALVANGSITVNNNTITYNENDIYVTPQPEPYIKPVSGIPASDLANGVIPAVPVQDVQVNGSSILQDGVAEIPVAGTNTLGLVQPMVGTGTAVANNGGLAVVKASSTKVKEGTSQYEPIVPVNQHQSTFYGLAKAAGADMKNIANTTVGTYPDAQKAAIQNMLGITDLISTEEVSTATAAHAINSTFMMNGKLHRATAAIAIGDAVEVGTNCEVVKADEVFVKNTDYASTTTAGVAKIGDGLVMDADTLKVAGASSATVKTSSNSRYPIVPSRQHESVFYGLSKVAGVDLKNETVTLGTYPETSKAAIRSLIGAAAASDIPSVPVQDVQVNGTSVLSQGVANVPMATGSALGVVMGFPSGGIYVNPNNGALSIVGANQSDIKGGTNIYKPVLPVYQHEAVFYGLAKAAGANMASVSGATVGVYPEAQKIAIRNMLGATSSNVIAVQDEQPTDSDTKVWLPETEPTGIEVPTYTEFQALDAAVVKKTDYAYQDVAGIVRVNKDGAMGLKITTENSTGEMRIAKADSTNIKNGTVQYKPIVPYNQHEAVFYGLAKAAGDTTQSASSNAIGTYTSEAKSAIQTMLGIKYTLTVTVLTQDNVTVTNQTVTVREGGPTGQAYATATYSGQPVSFALPTGFSYYVSVSDTLAHHFNPTTASGIITDADAAVTLTYSDFSSIQTAADIKAALNAGLDLTDLVGEQISCTWNNSTLVWDVVDYSNDTITLLTHDTLPTQLVFEPTQALMWCENGLAVGSYSFIDGSSTYYFTLTTAIPSGGQLRATTSAFQTYASMEATATLETGAVSTTEISDATSLGTTANGNLNHMSRVNYGSNNYKESALFQWLNSTEAANTPMPRITKFSRPCTYSVPGFLGALDSSFVAAIDDATWLCSTNNTYECPTSLGGTVAKSNAYTVTAKVGLASEMEIFGSYGGTADGSTVFDLFNGATADDRKKYQPGTSTARVWWLRSPYWGSAYIERSVYSSGTAHYNFAYNSYGVVPAVKISKTVVSE